MTTQYKTTINFSNAYHKNKVLSDMDREIKKGELRLRFVQLMRDSHTSLREEDATDLIKESMVIVEELCTRKN